MNMKSLGYADVFISHKQEDYVMAKSLFEKIKNLGFEPYLDIDDEEISRNLSAGALADRIRDKLRHAKSLLFVVTPNSIHSKWMPWELGFFDGRWGQPTIGLYMRNPSSDMGLEVDSNGKFTIREYLDFYEKVTDDTLGAFLARATSPAMLANRRDVDVDRFITMLTSAMNNPAAFHVGCLQYFSGMLKPWVNQNPLWQPVLDGYISQLRELRYILEKNSLSIFKDMSQMNSLINLFAESNYFGAEESCAPVLDVNKKYNEAKNNFAALVKAAESKSRSNDLMAVFSPQLEQTLAESLEKSLAAAVTASQCLPNKH